MSRLIRFVKRYPLSLLCVAVIWYLCLLFNAPRTRLNDVPLIDKWVHVAMYLGTCSLIWFEYLRALFKTKTRDEWCETLRDCDCCWAPVLGVDEVFADEQVLHRDMLFEMEDPRGQYGTVKQIGSAVKLSRTPARRELFPPRKGEHNAEYLSKIGYTDEEIAKFAEDGII